MYIAELKKQQRKENKKKVIRYTLLYIGTVVITGTLLTIIPKE